MIKVSIPSSVRKPKYKWLKMSKNLIILAIKIKRQNYLLMRFDPAPQCHSGFLYFEFLTSWQREGSEEKFN